MSLIIENVIWFQYFLMIINWQLKILNSIYLKSSLKQKQNNKFMKKHNCKQLLMKSIQRIINMN